MLFDIQFELKVEDKNSYENKTGKLKKIIICMYIHKINDLCM